jgi:hypothetical protein
MIEQKKCPYCNFAFLTGYPTQIYCSKKCKHGARYERKHPDRPYARSIPNKPPGLVALKEAQDAKDAQDIVDQKERLDDLSRRLARFKPGP